MLHALMLAAGRDQLIERIVAPHRAEQLHIAGAESPARLLGQRRFAHGEQRDGIEAGERALGLGIEGADRLQSVAEEIEADWTGARRIEVEDAAAHRILAGVGHGAGAAIADMLQPLDQIRHADRVARRERLHRCGKEIVARHALQHGVDRGEHDQRRLVGAAAMFGKLGECRDAAGDDFGIWRHPVVRNAVPGWEAQALHVGGEELQRVFQRREPLAVAGDMQDRPAGLAPREVAGKRAEHRGIEPFGHAAGDRRAAGEQPRDGQAFRCRCFGHGQSLAAFDAAEHDPVEAAQMPHQRIEVCRAQRIPFEQAQSDVRIGDFNEALHDADLDVGHGLYSLLGEAAEQEIQLLAAAMGCPVEGAAAAHGKIARHKADG